MASRQNLARIGTLVERKSANVSFPVPNGRSEGFARAGAQALATLPQKYLRTMTLDNGLVMQSREHLVTGHQREYERVAAAVLSKAQ